MVTFTSLRMRALTTLAIVATTLLLLSTAVAPASAASSRVNLRKVLGGYQLPVLVTHAGTDSRTIFIVEQTGKIKRATYRGGRWRKLGTFLDLSGRINDPRQGFNSERGLLGLAFHPDYAENGRLYVVFTRRGSGGDAGDTVVAEFSRETASKADPASQRTLMVVNQPYSNHNGGHLAFGPDGLLYIGLGDGGGTADPNGTAQSRSTRLGKILRIDPIDPDGDGPLSHGIPSSNPLVGEPGRDDIWAWGLRNPWRYSFDRATGDLWIGDVGQSAREEIDRSVANSAGLNAGRGKNFGWSRCEGSRRFPATSRRCTFGTMPTYDYRHGAGKCSVTGGHVHRGPAKAGWRGLYIGGDFCGRVFVLGSKGKVKLSRITGRRLSSFGEDAAGRIFATDIANGSIYIVRLRGPRP